MAGLADVHMRVDEPGHEHHVIPQLEGVPAGQPAPGQRLHRYDAAVGYADGERPLGRPGVAGDGAASPDKQVGGHGHDLDIKL
jgi:hypothetical protein